MSITLISTIISMLIAISAYKGYNLLKSPTLLRLFLAFSFISCGFLILSFNIFINTLLIISLIFHIIGYFLLSFSYSIQSLQFKHMIPAIALISIALSPLIIIPGDSLEHIIRSISFVLIVYGSTNAFVAYMMKKNVNTLMTSNGLALLAFGEFIGWYGFIYPQSFFYELSLIIKMFGLSIILTPIYLKIGGVRNGI